ncbi:MBL fold metallo-hydrolase [Gracilibacillus sp. YIM 98692]|uniref:MBL fold metallo-hydrolase n=1 Tax=Gracilibacillus sp. YIM 98692 TaxID=2663532 RepID=UPI0013D3B88E|nr:MBL fold metallo-hydrolase [Gracilibacillus sp. YIM 98692]
MDYIHPVKFFRRFFPVNCYLVEERNELTLIDAALPFSTNKIMSTAEKIGKPITRIVLTHAHADHVGALDHLKHLLPNASVYISKRDAKLLKGDRSLYPNEKKTPIRGGIPKNIQTKPAHFLKENDQIGSLIAISTPGHTPGSMSFLDSRTNAIIAGDSFQTRGGIAVSGQLKWTFPFPALATWNKDMAIESAKKIESYQPTLLAVGHGEDLKNPTQHIRKAIEEATKK